MSSANKISNTKKCYLVPMSTTGKQILLPDGVEVKVGRSSVSGITDANCSKKQVSFKADYRHELVSIKSIGRFPSHFKGKPMAGNETYCLRSNSVVEIVPKKVLFKVLFQTVKRSADQETEETPLAKKVMTSWKVCGSGELLMYISPGFDESRSKVASFDLDGTIIKTKSGRVFGKDFNDWELWDDSIESNFSNLEKENYKIVIFTNQAGLGTPSGKSKVEGFQRKVEKIIEALKVPVQVFVATSNGLYRKPSPGMWLFMKMRKQNLTLNTEQSFYVGDAAGRPANWKEGKKADFAMSDRMFAINIGIKFYTPEEYFLKEPVASYTEIKFHPWQFNKNSKLPDLKLPSANQEVIIMVGSPGSGKSHFIKHFIKSHGYRIVSRDQLGSWQKCVGVLQDILKAKRCAIVDNTNPDRNSRQRFIDVCKKYNVTVRCFFMETTLERCLHNNKLREIVDSEHEIITAPLINAFHSKLEEPTMEEGFSSIIRIPYVPHFENNEQEYFYNCYLVAK